MDVMKKLRLWRGLGRALNVTGASALVDPVRGLVNRLAAAPTRRRTDETPWAPFNKELAATRLAVVSTAGLYLEGQEPFDVDSARGDPTFRALPSDFDAAQIRIAHTHYPHTRAEQDLNVLLPIDRLRELVAAGALGGLAPNFYSFGFGGGLTRPYVEAPDGTAHELARLLMAQGADAALLVPA